MSNQFVDMGLVAPVNVAWEVTYACNLSCIHCVSDSGAKRPGELDTRECRQVIDALAERKVFQLSIGGGEPFVRPDFLDLMDYAHEKGMVTCISSNGSLIDEEAAERLTHQLVYLQISLDGARPETNDAIRGKGSFRRALSAVECLSKKGIEVSISTVLTKLSFPELDDLKDLAASHGAKFRVSRFRPSGRGKVNWQRLNASREQMLEFSDWLSENRKVSTGDSFFSVSREDRRHLGLNMCGAAKLTCCISPLGVVHPCAFLQEPEFAAGRLPRDSFGDLWDNSHVFHSFRRLEIKSCESCTRFDLCHGGCPAVAYHTVRKLGAPDPGCLANCIRERAPLTAMTG